MSKTKKEAYEAGCRLRHATLASALQMAAEWDDLFAEVRRLKAVETEFKTQIASLAKTLGVEPAIGWPGLLDKIKTIKATATPEWLAEQVTAQWHDDATVLKWANGKIVGLAVPMAFGLGTADRTNVVTVRRWLVEQIEGAYQAGVEAGRKQSLGDCQSWPAEASAALRSAEETSRIAKDEARQSCINDLAAALDAATPVTWDSLVQEVKRLKGNDANLVAEVARLREGIMRVTFEKDGLADRLSIKNKEVDDLSYSLGKMGDIRCELALALGLDGGVDWSGVTKALLVKLDGMAKARAEGEKAGYAKAQDRLAAYIERRRARLDHASSVTKAARKAAAQADAEERRAAAEVAGLDDAADALNPEEIPF